MKTILSVSLLCLSFSAFAQIDSTTNPSGVGFGAGTPGTTKPGVSTPGIDTPGIDTPAIGQPRGNEFPRQEMQDTSLDLPSTSLPDTTPAFPSTTPSPVPNTQDAFPGATNPTGTGVVPGPTGSGTVGP